MEKYAGLIFASTVVFAIAAASYIVLIEEKRLHDTAEKKCEAAGWTWLHDEAKCIMAKEVK